jgi:hypothetical protein
MKFAKPGIIAGSILSAAAFAPAQSYDLTIRADNPTDNQWVFVQGFPQEPPSTPKNQRVPVVTRRPTESLGVYLSPVPPAMAAQLRLKQNTGLVVQGIVPGGAAERAGIQQYDVISSFDSQPVTNPQQIQRSISRHKDGEEVPLDVIREGKHVTLSIAVQRPTQSADSDSNFKPGPQDKQQKQKMDEMSDRLKSEIEKQEKRIEELTEKIRAEAELAKKQIQELKEQLKRDAQQQKEQMQKESKDKQDRSDGDSVKPEKF